MVASTGLPLVIHSSEEVVHRLSTVLSTDFDPLLWITSWKVVEKSFQSPAHNARTWAKVLYTGLSTGPSDVLFIARCHGSFAYPADAGVRGATTREGPGNQGERSTSHTDTTARVRHTPIARGRRNPRTSLWITLCGRFSGNCGEPGRARSVDSTAPCAATCGRRTREVDSSIHRRTDPSTGRQVDRRRNGEGRWVRDRTGEEGRRPTAPLFSPHVRVHLSTRHRTVRSARAGP